MLKKINDSVELLSPAGDMESFKAAVQNGADAIYMGLDKYNARIMTNNFDIDEYIECIEYAHLRGVKVYLTINTLLADEEIKDACEAVLKLYSKGLDAVIVQDMGFAVLIKKIIPNIEMHASTQMSIYNLEQVKYLEKLGFSRVVLARELSIEEIEYICKNTKLDVEIFVHGAMCVSVSGQCLMSYEIGGRSANRGGCAQPCRMKYSLYSGSEEVVSSRYLLSKKDIYGLEKIDKLIKAGVKSFKIEGRNKTPEYVAITTNKYRKYMDKFLNKECVEEQENLEKIEVTKEDKEQLMQTFNRDGISTGYLDGVKYRDGITKISAKNTGLYLGTVCDQKSVYIKVKLEQDFDIHDGIEIYSRGKVFSNIMTCIKNEKYVTINRKCNKGEFVWIGDVSKKIDIGSRIYKTSSYSLNKEFQGTYKNNINIKKINVPIEISILKDKNLEVNINMEDMNENSKANSNIKVQLEYMPQEAKTKSLTKEEIEVMFEKTNDTSINFEFKNIQLDDNLFVPTSILNELRRKCISEINNFFIVDIDVSNELDNLNNLLKEFLIVDKIEDIENTENNEKIEEKENVKTEVRINSLFVYKYDGNKDYKEIFEDKYKRNLNRIDINVFDYLKNKEEILQKYLNNVEIYLYLPSVVGNKLMDIIFKNFENFLNEGVKGFIIGNIGYIEKLIELKNQNKYEFKIIADYSLNISNKYYATFLKNQGINSMVPAYDNIKLNILELAKIIDLEIIENLVTVMTSRYCMLGSFLGNIENVNECSKYCMDGNNYYLKDVDDQKYNIISDNTECIMKITKKIDNIKNYDIKRITSIRYCVV